MGAIDRSKDFREDKGAPDASVPAAEASHFAALVRRVRGAAGLSQRALARRAGLNPSHVSRIEAGLSRPGREAVVELARAAGSEESTDVWLAAAGYAPMPEFALARAAVRTRGAGRPRKGVAVASRDAAEGTVRDRLRAMGLGGSLMRHLLKATESADPGRVDSVARSVRASVSSAIRALEAPVTAAVIPAAGGQHRDAAPHMMLVLALNAIAEASECGIQRIILVLAPGMVDSLYQPVKMALSLTPAPGIELLHVVQPEPQGLGDAVLCAKKVVSDAPFAVLLPDDWPDPKRERFGRPAGLEEMIRVSESLRDANIVMVKPLPKSKMLRYGVAEVGTKPVSPRALPILRLMEKPKASDPILRSRRAMGIVGRYVLQPDIFAKLHELKAKGERPLQLTRGLEELRRSGQMVAGFVFKRPRRDVGQILREAGDLLKEVPFKTIGQGP